MDFLQGNEKKDGSHIDHSGNAKQKLKWGNQERCTRYKTLAASVTQNITNQTHASVCYGFSHEPELNIPIQRPKKISI